MAVTRVVNSNYDYQYYINDKAREVDMWLLTMEKSSFPYHYPPPMYKMWRHHTMQAISNDLNMIYEEYGFWQKCRPKD